MRSMACWGALLLALAAASSALPVGEPVTLVPGDAILEKEGRKASSEVPHDSSLEREILDPVGVGHDDIVLEGELEEILADTLADEDEVEYVVKAGSEEVLEVEEEDNLLYSMDYGEEEEEEVKEDAPEEDGLGEEPLEDINNGLMPVGVEGMWAEEPETEYDYSEKMDNSEDDIVAEDESVSELDYVEEEENMELGMEAEMRALEHETVREGREVFEVVVISGIAVTCLILVFGMVSLISSFLSPRPATAPETCPHQTQSNSSGGIIRQYTRLPVEIKNMLPSNVAYKHLYEDS